MPRYYCDYCDTYLTHDSPSVRKQHNAGYKHKANVRTYYQQFEEQQTQSFIDQKIKEHLGQTAFQVGATFNQFLQANPQAPRIPMLRPPIMPMGAPPFGIRPPVFPPPVSGAPGYGQAPTTMGPPGAPPMNMAMPPGVNSVPNGITTATTGAPNSFVNPGMYQVNPSSYVPTSASVPTTSSVPAVNSQETSAYSQTSENNH